MIFLFGPDGRPAIDRDKTRKVQAALDWWGERDRTLFHEATCLERMNPDHERVIRMVSVICSGAASSAG